MSYTYLQEQEGEYLEVNFSDIPQSVLSKLKSTQGKFYYSDSETESCQNFQYGMTSALSTADPGEDQLTFWQEDFHAKTSVQQVKEQELPDHVRDYGKSMRESLTKYGLDLSLPKTLHCFALGDLPLCSKIWPRWGMMLDGACWELGTSVRHISAIECGSWPTPTSSEHKYRLTGDTQQSKCLGALARKEAISGTPTQQKWGTPRCFMHKDALTDRGKGNLGEQVNEAHKMKKMGQLNPAWVEWLMGWPIGYTDLKPLETDRYRNVQQWHSEFYQKD